MIFNDQFKVEKRLLKLIKYRYCNINVKQGHIKFISFKMKL